MTTKKVKKLCKGTITTGADCQLSPQKDSEYCYQHNPEKPPYKRSKKILADLEAIGEEQRGQHIPHDSAISTDPAFAKYEIAKRIAHTLAQSNLVPDAYRGRPNDVFVAINMGAELGMEPFQAIQSIAVIEGKPCLYGDGLIGVVRASPKCLWIKETLSSDGMVATCTTLRQGDPEPVEQSYSMDDAVQAGISTKFNWKKHPKRMLQMRARAYCLRDAYPDLLKGLGVVEERQDHEDTPPPITGYVLPEPPPTHTLTSQPQDKVTLAQVEHAINQSETMEALLEAANMAKQLGETDSLTARVTYKRMRTALMETTQ